MVDSIGDVIDYLLERVIDSIKVIILYVNMVISLVSFKVLYALLDVHIVTSYRETLFGGWLVRFMVFNLVLVNNVIINVHYPSGWFVAVIDV